MNKTLTTLGITGTTKEKSGSGAAEVIPGQAGICIHSFILFLSE
ncbi:MAG TPA: hypothetical protein PKI34_10795 [Bacteroidales bacterium]|nr:hypothetical protein [Bacteroidales bacterium]